MKITVKQAKVILKKAMNGTTGHTLDALETSYDGIADFPDTKELDLSDLMIILLQDGFMSAGISELKF